MIEALSGVKDERQFVYFGASKETNNTPLP